jgi:DNA-directed RNA polymerase, mitochondrial
VTAIAARVTAELASSEAEGTSVAAVAGSVQTLIDRQRELEDHMLGLGGERFRRGVSRAMEKKEISHSGAGVKLLRLAVDPVEQGIRELLDGKGKRGPKHLATKLLAGVDPAAAAYITARTIIDSIHCITPLRVVANDITATILDELRYRRLEAKRPALFKYRMKHLTGSNYDHNKKVLDQTIRWAVEHSRAEDETLDVSDLVMSEEHRLLVGTKLIDIFVQTTGLVTKVTNTVAKKHKKNKRTRITKELYLQATDETKRWIERRNEVLEFLTPVNLPMVIPPRDWGKNERGGYHFALRNKYAFVRGANAEHHTNQAEIPLVYEAVNAIQQTPWKINPNVYKLVSEIVERGKAVGNLSLSDIAREALPAKPVDIATNAEARKRWRKDARAIHEKNHARQIRALGISKVLLAASRVATDERIYFPCSLDFRGRIYPLTHYLNPQGDDLSKSLLMFAEAKPLGEDGAFWLAIHGANCLDETPGDKRKVKTMTMAERASWVQKNTLRICAVADYPYADLWWTDADEPLQFYAFCCEWRGFYEYFLAGRGDEYVCSLPVSQDGSCNGLQHFSAMLRDPIGGKAVNLTPEEIPQDVYQAVTDAVIEIVQAAAARGEWIAQQWLVTGLIKRKLCKRPTMTFCYGSKRFGMAEQILSFLQEDKGDWQRVRALFTDDEGENRANEAAQWMASVVWDALGGTVVAAAQAMKWMQDCARVVVTQTNAPIEWTVPVTGFPVRQEYFVQKFRQIKTVLAGQVIQPSVLDTTDEVLTHKQANAIAPNIVHSLDAAALMMTVVRAKADGVEAFGMIHDSYATVPADCGKLYEATREAFVSLYRDNDVVAHLANCFASQLPETSEKPLPQSPTPGSLDINGVLESIYFFS